MRPRVLLTPVLLTIALYAAPRAFSQTVDKKEITTNGLDLRVTAEGRQGTGDGYRTPRGEWGRWGSWTGFGIGIESSGRMGNVDLQGRVLLPVRLETGNRVPVVEFSLARKGGALAYGRHKGRSTSLVARGTRVEGLRGTLQFGKVGVEFLQGETRTAREGRVNSETGAVTSWGRYRRTISNLNLSASPSGNWDVSLSLVRGQDDAGSIQHGAYKEKNLAGGGEVRFRSGRSRLNASVGVSQTGRQPLLGELSNRSGSGWEIEAQTTLAGHAIEAESYSVGKDYSSFAGSSRPANRRGFGVSDRFQMLRKKISLRFGYDHHRSVLAGAGSGAETTQRPWTKIQIRPARSLPRIEVRTELIRNRADGPRYAGMDATESLLSGIRLSDTWKPGESVRISPELQFEYSRRNTGALWNEEKRTFAGGGKVKMGEHEAGAQVRWAVSDRGSSGYREFSLDLRQKLAGGKRFLIETRESYELFDYMNSARRSGIDLAARVACEIVPGKVSVSGNYRHRSNRIRNTETDVQVSNGAFLAVTVTETVRVLER